MSSRSSISAKSAVVQEKEEGYKKLLQDVSTLYEVSKLLTSPLKLKEVLDLIAKITVEKLGVKGCAIRMLDEESGEMNLMTVYGLSQEYMSKGPIFYWKSVFKDVVMSSEVVFVPDVSKDDRLQYPEAAIKEQIKSMLCVALKNRDKVIGTLTAYTDKPHVFSEDEVNVFQAIANQASVAIENAFLYEEKLELEMLEKEMAIASEIQARLIPKEAPKLEGFQISARSIPCRWVGGDFFDLIEIPDAHIGMAIADISGKGMPAALIMSSTRAALRTEVENVYATKDIISKVNRFLCKDLLPGNFVSLFYAALDTKEKRLTYTNAGHNPPLLFRNGQVETLSAGGPVLGILPNAIYEEAQIHLIPGDVIVFYTDGVTEAMNQKEEIFGVNRLVQTILKTIYATAQEILDEILRQVSDFVNIDVQTDDRTLLVLKSV